MPVTYSPIEYGLHARCPGESAYPNLWHGLVGGIQPALIGQSPQYESLAPAIRPTQSNPTFIDWLRSPAGYAWGTNEPLPSAVQLSWSSTSPGNKFKQITPPCSWACMVYIPTGSLSAGVTYLFATDARSVTIPASNGLLRGLYFGIDGSVACPAVWCHDNTTNLIGSGSAVVDAGVATFPTGRWVTLVWVLRGLSTAAISSSNTELYIDGVPPPAGLSSGGTLTCTHVATSNTVINGSRLNYEHLSNLWIAQMLCWRRALSVVEARAISADIHAPFRRGLAA